ncbi:MAG: serpin family protein [Gemmatimonadota bacterium]|nr:serpin family protein [Gemmatimonadota bacterium]
MRCALNGSGARRTDGHGYVRAGLATVAGLVSVAWLVACGDATGPVAQAKIEQLPRALTESERTLVGAGEGFALDFLREVVRNEEPARNVFVSPLSASMALGMALAAAEGDTYEAMRGALRLGDLSRDEIGTSWASLMALLTTLDPHVRVEIGNSVWLRTGFVPESAYVAGVRRDFDARIATLDFDDPAAADTINAWVADATEGLIDGIVEPPIDPLMMAFLINAIYFQGDWTVPFDPADTRPGDFRREDGTTVQAPFMVLPDSEFPFARTPGYVAVELPYGGEAFAMTVVVPTGDTKLAEFVAGLDPDAWEALTADLVPVEVMVRLPKFRLEYDTELKDALRALGMGPAFDPGLADFSRLHRDALLMGLHISEVKQKAFVEVDEKGTRAAAVTAVGVRAVSMPPVLSADRPFLFAIRERLSGTLLFTGLVFDPTLK